MTVEELLKPRFKVIADYPGSECFIGSVICKSGDSYRDESGFMIMATNKPENYPAIFKRLEWWEDRKVEDMPEYLKIEGHEPIFKVEKWICENDTMYASLPYPAPSHTMGSKYYKSFPATPEEYTQYINKR